MKVRSKDVTVRLTVLSGGNTAFGLGDSLALNPIFHPPGVLMNAARERSPAEFWFYEQGVTLLDCWRQRQSLKYLGVDGATSAEISGRLN